MYAKENPFNWSLSSVLSHLEFKYFPLFLEWRYGKMIRKSAIFGISNSENIAEYENQIAGKNYVRLIGGDAVNSESFPVRQPKLTPGVISMIFLKGAVTHADFNGLDRLFKGMASYSGPYQIKLKLYGRNLENERRLIDELGIKNMVETLEYINQTDVNAILDTIDIGVGALGVHRKGLLSTTTIKSREYFARGLPFFYGHQDPDLSGHAELLNMCKEFPANDLPIDVSELILWYEKISTDRNLPDTMHTYAVNHLDYKIKMQRLTEYLKTLHS